MNAPAMPLTDKTLYLGTAAWAIPAAQKPEFTTPGSQLEKYGQKLNATEINTSFYRHHQAKTYERWAASVPANFRFSVKLYRGFTHENGLTGSKKEWKDWFVNVNGLGQKFGVLLIQTPGKLEFMKPKVERFLGCLREVYSGPVVLEARHQSWAERNADPVLRAANVSRVFADPEKIKGVSLVNKRTLAYFRLHGSPQIYKSSYHPQALRHWLEKINEARAGAKEAWCIFDNTGMSHALANALDFKSLLGSR